MSQPTDLLATLPAPLGRQFLTACKAYYKHQRYYYTMGFYGFGDRFAALGERLELNKDKTRSEFLNAYIAEVGDYPAELMGFYYCNLQAWEKYPLPC